MGDEKANLSSRIPATPETRQQLKDFQSGIGADTYEEALKFLLWVVTKEHTVDEMIAGRELRTQFKKMK